MADALKNLFGESTRVLVDDGEFNEVQGEFHHYDYSQRVTNNGCYNIIGNTIHNVSNTCPTDFYYGQGGRGSRSTQQARITSSSVTTVGAGGTNNALSPYHNPQSHVSIPNITGPNPLPYGPFAPQIPGQYVYTQSGDILPMSAVQSTFMANQMAHMLQELDSEFRDEEQSTSEDDMSAITRGAQTLTIEERQGVSPSSRSHTAIIHGSSSTAVSRTIIITGDHTEVDNNYYQSDFDSNKRENNIIENSFGEGEQENMGVWRMLVRTARRKLHQASNPRRRS